MTHRTKLSCVAAPSPNFDARGADSPWTFC